MGHPLVILQLSIAARPNASRKGIRDAKVAFCRTAGNGGPTYPALTDWAIVCRAYGATGEAAVTSAKRGHYVLCPYKDADDHGTSIESGRFYTAPRRRKKPLKFNLSVGQ